MGGAEKVYFETADLLKSKGHEVIFFSALEEKTVASKFTDFFVKAPNLKSNSLLEKITNVSRFIYSSEAKNKLEALIQKEQPDVAHLHIFYGNLTSSILPVLKKYNIPSVMSVHEYRVLCPTYLMLDQQHNICELCSNGNYIHALQKKCNKGSLANSAISALECFIRDKYFDYTDYIDRFIMVSKFIQKKHLEYKPSLKQKSIHLYNFIDLHQHASPVSAGKFYLYIGRLSHEKGLLTLLNAFIHFPDLELKIAGDGAIRQILEEFIVTHKMNNVTLLGFLNQNQIKALQEDTKFLIIPSEWYENNPMVAIETMAMSKPIIGADIGGIPELIKHDGNGFLFNPKSVDNLIQAIKQAENLTHAKYLEFCHNARKFAEDNFDREAHYISLIEIYTKLIKEK